MRDAGVLPPSGGGHSAGAGLGTHTPPRSPTARGQRRRLPWGGTREKSLEPGRCGQGRAACTVLGEAGWGPRGGVPQGKACAGAQSVGVAGTWRDGTEVGGWGAQGTGHRGKEEPGGGGLGSGRLVGGVAPRCLRWGEVGRRECRQTAQEHVRARAHTRQQSVPRVEGIKLNLSIQELEEACVL